LRLRAWASLNLPKDRLRSQWEDALKLPLLKDEKRGVQISLLSLDTAWTREREEGFRRYLGWAVRGQELDSVGTEIAQRFPPGRGSWDQQMLALDFEERRGRLADALTRCLVLRDQDPGKREKQKLHKNYAGLHYQMGSFEEALKLYRLYLDRYGDDSEVFLQIARGYDKLGNTGQALLWYDRFVDRYPTHRKTSEVYWLRGWEAEAAGKFDEAVEHYGRQLVQFQGTHRADWARFRMGLSRFKAASPEAALADFQAIRKQKVSNATPAGLYWEAKLLDSLGAVSAADSVRRELCSAYPLNFYGHLARQNLQARQQWPDSLDLENRLPSSQPEAVKRWMRETFSRYREDLTNPYESVYLPVSKMLQWKLDTLALWTLRTTPAKITNNPWFLFVQARRLHEAGIHREGYRYGLRLSYQFPEGSWGRVPRSVLKVVYPEP
jgi:tetratricopeptide (TPR) repeat protein